MEKHEFGTAFVLKGTRRGRARFEVSIYTRSATENSRSLLVTHIRSFALTVQRGRGRKENAAERRSSGTVRKDRRRKTGGWRG